jgi:adenylate cyclase
MEATESIKNLKIRSGMYAALPWDGKPVGVLCVDNPEAGAAFVEEDLRFMVAVANYAAAAVANRLLQDDLQANNRTMGHLLANFSPKLRALLVAKARHGQLQVGGETSEVTILMCDLRGFTRISAELACGDIVGMLNDYFSVLGDIIFEYDGTIDKFIGDAILAVFGSPEPDAEHASKAVRAALAMLAAVEDINARRAAGALPRCEVGVGIQTGNVLHGFIGNPERLEFTVIGDAVNRAARYCDAAGSGEILIGPATWAYVKQTVEGSMRTVATKHEGDAEVWVVNRAVVGDPPR